MALAVAAALDFSGKSTELTWVSKDYHYRQFEVPQAGHSSDTLIAAWRGERLGVEALVVCRGETGPVRVSLSDFIDVHALCTG